jgi:leucyl-tRNA synthetase
MNYKAVHNKWRRYWRENGTDKFDPKSTKPKYYCLEMFPYPSGATLHLGHFYMYSLPDAHARFKKMAGFNVFHPFGYDAFGLPAENHALKTGTHPKDNTVKNIGIFTEQMKQLGGMYDWDYSVVTCFPDYYKWTQWLFVKLFNAGLAYQKEAPVNWCDNCKTVLANEQVIGNACERCGAETERRNMKQWFFKITDYAEALLDGLDELDWPGKTKVMQRNWIGKSQGARIHFAVKNHPNTSIEVFTTRPDTLPGATFMVLAPEHPLVNVITAPENNAEVRAYIKRSAKKSDIERLGTSGEKTGVFTGGYAVNPLDGREIPVWIADYVLAAYGTGAIMAVPAHDERDKVFAVKYSLPIRHTVDVETEENKQKIIAELVKKRAGESAITYRLRDWSVGRQRYWGAPIPVIYCEHCGTVAVPEKDLPVELPYINDFAPKGAAPLASHPEFINCKCPKCGRAAKRECDTMDTFVCSSWYFLRFPDAHNDKEPFGANTAQKMLPVDKYIGGAEHSCMHLLYARFINHFLYDQSLVPFKEPFPSLVHQGMILAGDGSKMSKSKGNTITPDKYVGKYGSDILRLYMLFGFNFREGGPWNENTLKTITRFTERIEIIINKAADAPEEDKEVLFTMANTVKHVREDLENFSFNTAVARCMELLNAISSAKTVCKSTVKTLVLLLAPMLPHIAEEFWELLGEKPSIFDQNYPEADKKYFTRGEVEIAVQINSKIVKRITIPVSMSQADAEILCAEITENLKIKKTIYVPGRLINFIV